MTDQPSAWRICSIRDLARGGTAGGPFGSSLGRKDYTDSGVPVIRGSNLGDPDGFRNDAFAWVSEAKADELRRNLALPGDIVLTQRGTLGQVARVPVGRHARYVISQSQMRVRPDPSIAEPGYVLLAMRSKAFIHQIHQHAIATGVPHINLGILEALTIPLPPLDQQVAIADVLGALDDKIESNRRLAEVVDELVRAEVALAASGGRDAAVADLVTLIRTTVRPGSVPPTTRYVGLEHMPRGRMILDSWGVADGLGSGKAVFAPVDILFGKLRPYFKKVGLAPQGGGVCSTDILVLRPTAPDLTAVALAVLASDDFIEFASNAASGTRMPRASWDHMKTYPVALPSREAAAELAERLDPLLAAAQRGVEESLVLAELRDALLPELLSGRLRVPVAEELVEAAT